MAFRAGRGFGGLAQRRKGREGSAENQSAVPQGRRGAGLSKERQGPSGWLMSDASPL